MKTAQEILAEWADPETGGTMPRDVREAALSVLEELDRLKAGMDRCDLAHHEALLRRTRKADARVKELAAELAKALRV